MAMTSLHDITCPQCGSGSALVKEALDTYRCQACETTFSATDVLSED